MTPSDDILMPLATAARQAGLSYAALHGAGLRGHIRLRRIGRRIFVPLRDLEEFRNGREMARGGQRAPAEAAR